MCSHCDGSLSVWNLRVIDKPVSINYPHSKNKNFISQIKYCFSARICKEESHKFGAITKVVWSAVKSSYVLIYSSDRISLFF
jgi:hypothetical protein